MNPFLLIVLLALAVEFTLNLAANLLNLRALRLEPPSELQGVYNPDEYARSQKYTRTTTRFGLVADGFSLAVTLGFWFSGGFNYLDRIVRSWGFGPIVNGILYVAILGTAYALLTLPFSVYGTFVIEEQFGFNRTTPRTFVMDRLKGAGLTLLLGGPLLVGVLALFEYARDYAWLYCWLAVSAFSLLVQFVAPVWIMPLFNKFTPLEPGELRDAIVGYARSVGYQVSGIFVIDSSRRTTRANAFFTGFGPNKRIALFDTLVEKYTARELVAILGHEIAHCRKKHILQATIIGILHTGLIFILLSIVADNALLSQAFFMDRPSVYTGLVFFGLLYTPAEMLLSVAMRMLSRRNESQADRFAAETAGEPTDLISALTKLAAGNLSNLTPHPFYVFINYSHPPLLERVRAIRQYGARRSGESS